MNPIENSLANDYTTYIVLYKQISVCTNTGIDKLSVENFRNRILSWKVKKKTPKRLIINIKEFGKIKLILGNIFK